MARFDAIVSSVVRSHDGLARSMAAASAASVQLSLNPRNEDAAAQWRTSLQFIHSAVAHMGDEEAHAFAEAEDSGVSPLILELLRIEHARLRILAADILRRDGPDDEGALLLLRFLHRFERHVGHEEWCLARRASCT